MTLNRKITLVPHNPNWDKQFKAEAATLTQIFGDNLIGIHHIGSTAVSGIQAKPIIDMMPIVWDIEQVDTLNDAMAELGYIHKGEHGIPGRRYFRKGSDTDHTHHIHVYQIGNPNIAQHLLFRDYLCEHPEKARAYNDLKVKLAQQYRDDPLGYTNAKFDFILALIQEAVVWHRERERPLRTLLTARLHLIALSQSQLESCLQDPSLLAANLDIPLADDIFGPIVRRATAVKVSKMRHEKSDRHHWNTYWLIVRRDDNVGIGTIGFKGQPDSEQYKVEIGYGLSVQHRQQGFMTEAAQTMVRWALAQPDCLGVYAHTAPDNNPSHHILQKIGMTRNGENDGEWVWEMKVER